MNVLGLAGFLWNLPNTGLGCLLAVLSDARPERSGCVINFRMRRGLPLATCRRLGISAFTVGDCVLYAVEPTRSLRVHEGRHVSQYRLLGPFFLPVYFLLMPIYGYWNHPLERDARKHEARILGCIGPSSLAPPSN